MRVMNLGHRIDRDEDMLTTMTLIYGDGDDIEYDVDDTSFPVLEVKIELNFPICPYHGVEDSVPLELKINMSGCMHTFSPRSILHLYFNYEQGPAV